MLVSTHEDSFTAGVLKLNLPCADVDFLIIRWGGGTLICRYLRAGQLLARMTSLALPWRIIFCDCLYPRTYLPLFITSCSLELIDSKDFFCGRMNRTRYDESKHTNPSSSPTADTQTLVLLLGPAHFLSQTHLIQLKVC